MTTSEFLAAKRDVDDQQAVVEKLIRSGERGLQFQSAVQQLRVAILRYEKLLNDAKAEERRSIALAQN